MNTNRLLFDDLIELNKAAEACHGLALEFVRHFAEPVESSICDDVAHSRAHERLRHAEKAVEGIRDAITKWDLSPNAGDVLQRIAQAIGLSQPIISFGDRTYLTAHEAAREIAEQIVATSGRLTCKAGYESALLNRLENRLKRFSFPDLSARIEGEFWEASKLIEIDAPDDPATAADDDDDPIEDVLFAQQLVIYRCLKRRHHWVAYKTLADEDCDWKDPPPADHVVHRALKKLQSALSTLAHGPQMKIENEYRRVKLIPPVT